MKIIIETIEHSDQRYNTCGDWQYADGALRVMVSRLENMEEYKTLLLVGLHEVIEATLCHHAGITQQQVDNFDLQELYAEPGEQLNCPYRRQHQFADAIERTIASALGVNWQQYEAEIAKLACNPRADV